MELRRIEGVLLQEAILGSLEQEIVHKAHELTLKLLTRVPDIIKNMLLNQRIKGRVLDVGKDFILLKLDTGEEVFIKNAFSIGLSRGEEITLQLINKNPYILKIVGSKKFLKATAGILKNLDNLKGFSLKDVNSFRSFKNSGLFYERNLLKSIISGDFSELKRDLKFKALLNRDLLMIEFITNLQLFVVESGYKRIFLPIKEGKNRINLLINRENDGVNVVIELQNHEIILLLEINYRKKAKFIDLRISSNSHEVLKRLGDFGELKNKLPIGKIEKEVLGIEELRKRFLRAFSKEMVLNLKV